MNILPYFYHLVNTKTHEFYFGYRCKNKISAREDLGFVYFTSNPVISKNFSEWKIIKIIEFDNKNAAYDFEQNMIRSNIGNSKMVNKHYVREGKSRFFNPKGKLHHKRNERLKGIDIDKIFDCYKDQMIGFSQLSRKFSIHRNDIIYLFRLNNLDFEQYLERNRRKSISKKSQIFNKTSDNEKNLIINMIKDGMSLSQIYKCGYSYYLVKKIIVENKLEEYINVNKKYWSGTAAQTKVKNNGGTRSERASNIIQLNISEIEKLISLGLTTKEIVTKLDVNFQISRCDLNKHLSNENIQNLFNNWRRSCRSKTPRPV